MRLLFYSTSSNVYDGKSVTTTTIPAFTEQWDSMAEKYKNHEFLIATQLPGMFLCDTNENEIIKSKKIRRFLITSQKETEIADELALLNPDLAVALSFYVQPYDWLSAKDSMVADFLRKKGIKTICHPLETSLICFDKWRTHEFLEKIGLNHAKAVYLQHELYINAGNRNDVRENVYKSALFHQIKKLNFPLIIKDTTGLSSFGADVVKNFEEALGILKSKRTTSDRIIEEMISGEQFGLEVYGTYDEKTGLGSYTIFPPLRFSTNQYGITSPKQSLKFGPLGISTEEKNHYKIGELNEMILKLAQSLKLNGCAQIDLVFSEGKWFIIEINPRLSGMSTTYAASRKMFLCEMILNGLKIGDKIPNDFYKVINIKFPIIEREKLNAIKSIPYIALVNQIENHVARQIREQGYCEVILTGETNEILRKDLLDLRKKFSRLNIQVEERFFETALNFLKGKTG